MTLGEILALVGSVGGFVAATWTLRGGLANIEAALREHVGEDRATHREHDSRIVNLEKWRDGKR